MNNHFIINDIKPLYVYFVLGLRRSGNHLFISWLVSNFNKVLLFNNIFRSAFISPKHHSHELQNKWIYQELNKFHKNINNNLLTKNDDWTTAECLIISIEDVALDKFKTVNSFFNFPTAKYIIKVVIIRDILNCLASRMTGNKLSHNYNMEADEITVKFWLYYYYSKNYIHFNYNKFIINPKYRIKLKNKLNLKTIDDTVLSSVSQFFFGSSFNPNMKENTNIINFFTRYKQYTKNIIIQKIIHNQKIMNILYKHFYIYPKIALVFSNNTIPNNWNSFLNKEIYKLKYNIYFNIPKNNCLKYTFDDDPLNFICILCSDTHQFNMTFKKLYNKLLYKYSRNNYKLIQI